MTKKSHSAWDFLWLISQQVGCLLPPQQQLRRRMSQRKFPQPHPPSMPNPLPHPQHWSNIIKKMSEQMSHPPQPFVPKLPNPNPICTSKIYFEKKNLCNFIFCAPLILLFQCIICSKVNLCSLFFFDCEKESKSVGNLDFPHTP